jgi:hypothetical protein
MRKALLASVACAPLLFGCQPQNDAPPLTLSQAESVQLENQLDQILNTGTQQLTLTANVSMAMTPPDADGAQCANAGITVIGEMQKVNTVLQGQQLGGIPAAEVASVMIPGTAQFDNVVNVLGGGCFAKAHDISSAITIASSPAAILALALPQLAGLAPAVAPLAALP